MKRLTILCLALLLVLSLSGCGLKPVDWEEAYTALSNLAEKLGSSQITADEDLIGSRTTGEDAYTGSYRAECGGSTGKDVIFGGGSVEERRLYVSGIIEAEAGAATVRIRRNDEVIEITPNDEGYFETELGFTSGGNYIMLQYEDFEGTVELSSEYAGAGASDKGDGETGLQ